MSAGAIPQAPALGARPDRANYKVVYSFHSPRHGDGQRPFAGLIEVGGTLYGTTFAGGASPCGCSGTVFSVTPSGTEKVLHSFSFVGGDGDLPEAGLTDVGGTLYGTTSEGGSKYCGATPEYYGCGTVFSITPNGTEKVLYSFGPGRDGRTPAASLIEVKGKLYGTTPSGGGHHYYGTVFSVTPGGTEKVLHRFNGADGADPTASLIEVKGKLYGTTISGGAYGDGTVFSIMLSGKERVLHSFNGTDGDGPGASLIEVNGTLYGTTEAGGGHDKCLGGCGTVFSITPSGTEKVLHSFVGTEGSRPSASLIEVKGKFYGTTADGGAYHAGTVFSITLGGTAKVLHNFGAGSDGSKPLAGLTNLDGTLYGTTYSGGKHKYYGTVFALTP